MSDDKTAGGDVILVWELVPERTQVYIIPDAPAWLLECHGCHVNGYDRDGQAHDAVMDVMARITEKPEYCEDPNDLQNGIWVQHKIYDSDDIGGSDHPVVPSLGAAVKLVVTGFYL